ncbi:MAG: DUF4340 domain-containing protein [Candidatus Scalindua sp.]|nr:DUF4340 domain-containing protein [Candidatus Scalindua sp.]
MSSRKLIILGIITACMIAWAVVQSHLSKQYSQEPKAPVYLFQGLDPSDIGSIVLGKGEDAVTLKREDSNFVVTNKDGYPAVTQEINALITTCLDIQTTELYTENPANHKDLGVTEEEAKHIVKFLRPDSALLAGVIVGKDNEKGHRNFVRLIPGDRVYVAPELPWIKDQAMNYVKKEIISVSREDIESVTVHSPAESYTLHANKEGEGIVLENPPAGKKLKEGEGENIFTALTYLQFQDVKKISQQDGELPFERKFICRKKDSTVYTLKIARKDGKTYLICDCEFTDNTPVTKENSIESEEELKKKESKLLAMERAKEFTARHTGWIYEIAEHDAGKLVKELSELLEDEEVSPKDNGEE